MIWNGGGGSWLDIEIDGMGFEVGGDENGWFRYMTPWVSGMVLFQSST